MFDLDTPLLQLTPYDDFTARDAVQGVCVTGATSSGKTSASQYLAKSYLQASMGGLVMCAKPEEADLWRQYCSETGRLHSLIVIDGEGHRFNFLTYELARQGAAGINSVVECLMRILEIVRTASPNSGRPGDPFWEDTTKQLLRNTILILYLATGTVRIADILQFVRSAPTSPDQMTDPGWQRGSFFCEAFASAAPSLDDATGERIIAYWQRDFAALDPKTRGNIVISLTTALDRFNHGWLRETFCTDTTVVPEMSFHGAIFLLAMPALTRNEDGIIAQQLFKYMWQRAVLNRNAQDPEHRERPVFLWADEAQYFVNSYDAEFLSTCRGSRCCTVFLSQNLPTYFAKMSGENSRDRVHQLLGNLGTKIWHNNSCTETNRWASETIGRAIQRRATYSATHGSSDSTSENYGANVGDGTNWGTNRGSGSSFTYNSGNGSGGSWSAGVSYNSGRSSGGSENRGRSRTEGSTQGTNSGTSDGYTEQMDYILEPGAFSRILRTGGPPNGFIVSAVWYQAGRTFRVSNGNSFLAEFVQ